MLQYAWTQTTYATWNKQDIKGKIVYNSTYMKYLE